MDTPQHELEFTLENLQIPHEEINKQARDALAFVGLEKLSQQKLTTLSGGQLQRVALAITIAMKARSFYSMNLFQVLMKLTGCFSFKN